MTAPATTVTPVAERAPAAACGRDAWRRLLRNKPAMLGVVCIVLFVGAAVLRARSSRRTARSRASSRTGCCRPRPSTSWARTSRAATSSAGSSTARRSASSWAWAPVVMALTMGGLLGALAGGLGGRVDAVLMRARTSCSSIPGILLAIGIVAWLDRGLRQIMLAVAVTYAPIFARILRESLLALRGVRLRHRRALGRRGRGRVLTRHMMPNALTPLIVQATLVLATAVIDIAGLGFLGLGPPDPRTPEWGTMLTDARRFLAVGAVAGVLPRGGDRHQRDRLQPARRRPARVARPEAQAMTGTLPTPPVATHRRARAAARRRGPASSGSGPTTGRSTPSTASRSSSQAARRLGLVGESGCGKSVTNLAIIRLLPKPAGPDRGRHGARSTARTS